MTYEVSQKGSDFLDETSRHWGNLHVSKDDMVSWLWEIRETGDYEAGNVRLIKKVGLEGAERVLNWAHDHGYFVKVEDVGTFEDYKDRRYERDSLYRATHRRDPH